MVSHQGTYQFFDNSFAYPEAVMRPSPVVLETAEHTIMGFLKRHHPRFAFVVERARLDRLLADLQSRYTVFAPPDEAFEEGVLLNMDTNTARKIVKYHMMVGAYPSNVLLTSPYQQLQTTIKGYSIYATIDREAGLVLNFTVPVVAFDAVLSNGIVHAIAGALSAPA
jgi:uncharacterized surface protein with fasciclin (FAS1) repeats